MDARPAATLATRPDVRRRGCCSSTIEARCGRAITGRSTLEFLQRSKGGFLQGLRRFLCSPQQVGDGDPGSWLWRQLHGERHRAQVVDAGAYAPAMISPSVVDTAPTSTRRWLGRSDAFCLPHAHRRMIYGVPLAPPDRFRSSSTSSPMS